MKKYDDNETRAYDLIRRYYLEDDKEIKLSPKVEAIRRRWMSAHTLVLESDLKEGGVVNALMKMYGITERQAYRDLLNSTRLFGSVQEGTKAAWRYMVTQWAIDMLRKARLKHDLRAMDAALGRIISANNLDKDDSWMPDPEKMYPPQQLLTIDYDFFKSPGFKMIDKTAQEKITKLYEKLQSMAEEFMVSDYLDILLSRNKVPEDSDLEN